MWPSQGNERGNAVKVTWASPARATAGQVVQQTHCTRSAECQSHRWRRQRPELKGQIPSSRKYIKFSDATSNRTREGRNSTDHPTAMVKVKVFQPLEVINAHGRCGYSFYKKLNEPQDQSCHEGVKKISTPPPPGIKPIAWVASHVT